MEGVVDSSGRRKLSDQLIELRWLLAISTNAVLWTCRTDPTSGRCLCLKMPCQPPALSSRHCLGRGQKTRMRPRILADYIK